MSSVLSSRSGQPHSVFRLSGDPLTDIRRTISELRSVGLAASKQLYGFSVDKRHVFKIDREAAGLPFQYTPKQVDILPGNRAAYQQDHKIVGTDDSVDS